jgi:hypothetical protein
MPNPDPDVPPLEEPLAELERRLIDDYLRDIGEDPAALRQRTDAAAKHLLASASQHAALKLSEVEARAHYVEDIHDRHR